jgi:predicted esterase
VDERTAEYLKLWQDSQEKCFDCPTFVGHGTADTVVPVSLAASTKENLCSAGISNVDVKTYNGIAHSCSSGEVDDIVRFMKLV